MRCIYCDTFIMSKIIQPTRSFYFSEKPMCLKFLCHPGLRLWGSIFHMSTNSALESEAIQSMTEGRRACGSVPLTAWAGNKMICCHTVTRNVLAGSKKRQQTEKCLNVPLPRQQSPVTAPFCFPPHPQSCALTHSCLFINSQLRHTSATAVHQHRIPPR